MLLDALTNSCVRKGTTLSKFAVGVKRIFCPCPPPRQLPIIKVIDIWDVRDVFVRENGRVILAPGTLRKYFLEHCCNFDIMRHEIEASRHLRKTVSETVSNTINHDPTTKIF